LAEIDWPESLPKTMHTSGVQAQYNDPVLRTSMDAGPEKTRLRYTAATQNIQGRLTLTAAQWRILNNDFYKGATKYGALRFNFTDPISLDVSEFRFASPPSASGNDGGLFDVSISLMRFL
jgi:hypothetical protein